MTTILPPCEGCREPMVAQGAPPEPGTRRHDGNGLCTACGQRRRRAEEESSRALFKPEPWTADALCSQTDPEIFFPEKGGSTREAKAVCRVCSVRTECLLYALKNQERFGIYGGLSERERRKIARERGMAA